MQTNIVAVVFVAAIAAGIILVSAIIAQAQAQNGLPFAEVNTQITGDKIVVTITRSPEAPPGPIVIIPPNETEGEDNATVILPQPPVDNETGIQPPGNITIIEPDGNVTQVPDGNITQTPGNVTVIDPPAPPACECPVNGGITLPVEGNDTTIITNETTVEEAPPAPAQLPVIPEEEGGNGGDGNGGNGNGDSDGQESNGGG